MDKDNDIIRERERAQEAEARREDEAGRADEAASAPGDILGLSRVRPDRDRASSAEDGDADQPPLPSERDHVGSRDLTEGTTGGTGPDTGGSGVFRGGSGATGTDIGR